MKYYSLNDWCREAYGRKLYKLALDSGCTCPNRDGTLDTTGCLFCSAGGSGDFAAQTIDEAKARVASKFRDEDAGAKYIAYYQSFSGTYPGKDGSLADLRERYLETIRHPEVAVLSIATRPDCLGPEVLDLLAELRAVKPVWVELGLQTSNEATAAKFHRCYENRVYEQAVRGLNALDIPVVTHLILGLPGETPEDMETSVRYASACGTWGLKLQLLHFLEGTAYGDAFEAGDVRALEMDEYIALVCRLLTAVPEDVVLHRLTGDGPKRTLLAPLWSADKKRVLNALNKALSECDVTQGSAV